MIHKISELCDKVDVLKNKADKLRKDKYNSKEKVPTVIIDEQISGYLLDASEALNFYYTVEDERTGIKISFILIYLVVVSLLLFLSISVAIKFSSRFFRSINNLISASSKIGKGNLESKVPEI